MVEYLEFLPAFPLLNANDVLYCELVTEGDTNASCTAFLVQSFGGNQADGCGRTCICLLSVNEQAGHLVPPIRLQGISCFGLYFVRHQKLLAGFHSGNRYVLRHLWELSFCNQLSIQVVNMYMALLERRQDASRIDAGDLTTVLPCHYFNSFAYPKVRTRGLLSGDGRNSDGKMK
jgi:hypothetical protein